MSARLSIGLAALLAVFVLTACNTLGGGDGSGARQPASLESPENEARQRAKVHTELGALYLQEGRFAISLEEGRIALAADSHYAPAYNLLALTHMYLEEPRLAEENFQRALQAAPGDPEISNNYGWFLCQHGRESMSFDYFMRAARNPLYPAPTKAYTNAGICAIRIKEDKKADEYLLRAMQIDPANTLAAYWLADIAFRTQRLAEAKQRIQELEKQTELNAEATWLALRLERRLGNRDGEARHAAQLRRKFPNSPELRKLLQGEFE